MERLFVAELAGDRATMATGPADEVTWTIPASPPWRYPW